MFNTNYGEGHFQAWSQVQQQQQENQRQLLARQHQLQQQQQQQHHHQQQQRHHQLTLQHLQQQQQQQQQQQHHQQQHIQRQQSQQQQHIHLHPHQHPQHHQQKQQQHHHVQHQQQQLQQQHIHHHQQQQQQQQEQQQQHRHHSQKRSQHSRSTERAWAESPDDVSDVAVVGGANYRSGSAGTTKSQVTPPLDLSDGPRLVESPLDLSVKTRKRCADTTDYAEQLAGRGAMLAPEPSGPKRQCLTKSSFALPPGHPSHSLVHEQTAVGKHHMEIASLNKMVQKQQMQQQQQQQQHVMRSKYEGSQHKFDSSVHPSPIQQHAYNSAERQIPQKARQSPMPIVVSQSIRQHSSQHPVQYSHHGAHSVPQRRQSSPYEIHQPVPQKLTPSNQTESVALKGFFEPTQKVTVNAVVSSSMGSLSRHHPQKLPALPSPISSERMLSRNALGSMGQKINEDHRHPVSAASMSYGPQMTSLYQQIPGATRKSAPVASPSVNTEPISDLEVMQIQSQYKRQMHPPLVSPTVPCEADLIMAAKMKNPIAMASQVHAQEQQKMAYMMEMQKHQSQHRKLYPEKEMTPYVEAAIRQQTIYPDSIRHDKTEVRCMKVGQPVPLPDVHPGHVLERVPNADIFRARSQAENKIQIESALSQATTSLRSIQPSTVRYDQKPRYRMPDHDVNPGAGSRDTIQPHPSVIQRPPGFIPPRIVMRSESHDDSANATKRPNERERMYTGQAPSMLADYGSHGPSRPDMMSQRGRSQYSSNKDMLSGRDVLRIQQRAAEQRNSEMAAMSSKHHHSKHTDMPATSVDPTRYAERRRSLPDINNSRPQSRESGTSVQSNKERPRLMSPQGRGMSGPTRQDAPSAPMCSPPVIKAVSVLTSPGRSITKGTSGTTKPVQGVDFFSQFLMRELKKTETDDTVNPFANRSLLDEYDRSANNSPVHMNKAKIETTSSAANTSASNVDSDSNKCSDINDVNETSEDIPKSNFESSYTLPLHIAIPGRKTSTQLPASSETKTPGSIVSKEESLAPKAPKFMSRKQMILNAFRQDEDKNKTSVDIDKDEKVPVPIVDSAKTVSIKTEKDSSQMCPPSPKMPILSPQERSRSVNTGPAEQPPPNLENASAEKGKEKLSSLEEHLHRMISNALNKDSKDNDKDVVEAVCREITTQGLFSRQTSLSKNIPVANVAPFVHGKAMSETQQDSSSFKSEPEDHKTETDTDAEDAKMAEVVTRSLFGDRLGTPDVKSEQTQNQLTGENDESDRFQLLTDFKTESPFDENSNSMRMSPGIKKLMLYRHRDVSETATSANDNLDITESVQNVNDNNSTPSHSDVAHRSDKGRERNRNVFGSFNEIVAQPFSSRPSSATDDGGTRDSLGLDVGGSPFHEELGQDGSCWTGYQMDPDDEQHCDKAGVPTTGYDGDDEQGRDIATRRKSNTQQKADRLIKKARHRRNSRTSTVEGGIVSRHALHSKRHAHKGFVDFTPQVLPRRTRSKHLSSLTGRKRSKSQLGIRQRRSSAASTGSSKSPSKTRRRRASSLDREVAKCKAVTGKSKTGFHSDNDLDPVSGATRDPSDSKNNSDESTDEEYFQNEFKNFIRKKGEEVQTKKGPAPSTIVRKKKSFHFKQKYIFQKKRKTNKGRGKGLHVAEPRLPGPPLDEIYSFHEEGQAELRPLHYPCGGELHGSHSNIPVPGDLRRVTVNKDTGETALHRAARLGFEEVVLYLLATSAADVNARDNAGYTPLHECSVRGRVAIAKHLLAYGADVNVCSSDGIRPVHDAVENDHVEMVRLLLSFGSDPTLTTYAGRSLTKIARTDRMRQFLQDYFCDLNGYESASSAIPWEFKTSTQLAISTGAGCELFADLPSDPEDESHEMLVTSAKPLCPVRRLAAEPGKRVEDYLLLEDLLAAYCVSRSELEASEDRHKHTFKSLSNAVLNQAHRDSVFMEYFVGKDTNGVSPAIRMVDSTTFIGKLEKLSGLGTTSTRRVKT